MLSWTLKRLKSANPDTRWKAATKLGHSKDPKAVRALLDALEDSWMPVARAAAESLGTIMDLSVVEPLLEKLRKGNSDAACALGKLGDQRAVQPLVVALEDNRSWVRYEAGVALQQLNWIPQTDRERALLAVALRKWDEAATLGSVAAEPLMCALGDIDFEIKMMAARTLGRIKSTESIELLVSIAVNEVSFDDDNPVRNEAIQALVEISDPRTPLLLAAELKNESRLKRTQAMEALTRILGPSKAQSLARILGHG